MLRLKNFSPEYIRWCGMHTLNLGLAQFLVGSGLRLMLRDRRWCDLDQDVYDDDQQLKRAYAEFEDWCKTHRIPHLDFKIKDAVYMLHG